MTNEEREQYRRAQAEAGKRVQIVVRKEMLVLVKAAIVSAAVGAALTAAHAADFVPITITEADVQQLQNYFHANTPPAYSEPVIQWLTGLENKAQALKAEAEKKAADAAKAATPPTDK